ncbi:MAG: AarF/ABC1/UbiB kinase family protein [Spirulinaceae cyanobacterium SM2_1_0]|nr:AarF/ABC1/UbiB kinase family protein [Spirulinaceae cyanobacterium SM2_1_0]
MLVKRDASPPLQHWQQPRYSRRARRWDILRIATRFLWALGWDRLTGNRSSDRRQQHAQWLVQRLLELGPTFIKLGQALSTRPDLIPREYTQALGELQDRVPPFSSELAIAVIERELNSPLNDLFREFDRYPLAAASLGQVHKAILHSGEAVVVKVQRPGLADLFQLDFEVLHQLAHWLNRYWPDARKYNLEELYREFFGLLYQEIDYIHEGKNADRFRHNFQDVPQIHVPEVYWRYTTAKVLTLEYAPGIKITDRATIEACNLDPDRLIQLGVSCYLKQMLDDGFFQSDPHPGNMAVGEAGELIFYDFGTMTEVKGLNREQMVRTFFAVMRKDTDGVIDSLTYMGFLEPSSDMTAVRRLVAFVLDQFREKPIDLSAFQQMSSELYIIFEQQPFRLPAQMMFAVKAVTTLDGIARSLNPQYNLIAASTPFLKQMVKSAKSGNLLRQLARQTRDFVQYKLTQPSAAERAVRQLEERIEQGELQFRVRSLTTERATRRIYLALKCLIYTSLCATGMICGTLLVVNGIANWAIAAFCFGAFWFLILGRAFINLLLRERFDRLAER